MQDYVLPVRQKTTTICSRTFIKCCVYLKASRSSTMWFVDVHSYKLPSPSRIFMEHLWHRGSTHINKQTKHKKRLFKVLEKTQNTHKGCWRNHHEASVTKKESFKALNTQTEIMSTHMQTVSKCGIYA